MMNTTVVGRIYNGTTHDWTANKGKDNEQDRTLFRGRLNYRDNENGNYHWIDAVCFKDFGESGGLVAWMDEHYSAENSENENGGDAIVLIGYVRPTEKRKTIELKGKKNGKTVTKEIPNVPYDTFEFVITGATFPPTSQGKGKKSEDVEAGEDFDFDDDLEVADAEDDATEEESKEEKKKSSDKKKPSDKKKADKSSKSSKKDEDDDFFEE